MYSSVHNCTALYSSVQCCTAVNSSVQYYATVYIIVLLFTVLYSIVLLIRSGTGSRTDGNETGRRRQKTGGSTWASWASNKHCFINIHEYMIYERLGQGQVTALWCIFSRSGDSSAVMVADLSYFSVLFLFFDGPFICNARKPISALLIIIEANYPLSFSQLYQKDMGR